MEMQSGLPWGTNAPPAYAARSQAHFAPTETELKTHCNGEFCTERLSANSPQSALRSDFAVHTTVWNTFVPDLSDCWGIDAGESVKFPRKQGAVSVRVVQKISTNPASLKKSCKSCFEKHLHYLISPEMAVTRGL
jgi:hypothetical protein